VKEKRRVLSIPVRIYIPFLTVSVLLGAVPAVAGVQGSAHDFTGFPGSGITPGGACSACHFAHGALDQLVLWPRDLTDERSYFDQTVDPAYVAGTTLACYDCHDNQREGEVESPTDPDKNIWPLTGFHGGEPGNPQDIAFDDYPGVQGSGQTGYYELSDGTLPNPPILSGPTDGSPTGGHYWKRPSVNISGTPVYEQGDKLHCTLCHDPHNSETANNDVMFRTSVWDGNGWVNIGSGYTSSTNTRDHDGANPDIFNGRGMCAACHSYSNQGTPIDMWGDTLPEPPATVPQHEQLSLAPCTDCHGHNFVSVSCSLCHANPPLEDSASAGGFFDPDLRPRAESYAGGAGAHRRHLEALGASIFDCDICHGPSPGTAGWHNFGDGTVLQNNVDIMGQSAYWDPGGSRVTGYVGSASGETVPAGYEFTAKGGNDGGDGGRCFGLACHGNPPDTAGALNWTDDMVDDTTGGPVSLDICRWCHDATPATIDGGTIHAPNVMGSGSTFGAEINGHGLGPASRYDLDAVGDGLGSFGAGKDCTVCHDATYQANPTPPPDNVPAKTHFDGAWNSAEKRLRDTINTQVVAGTNDACLACHQNAGPDAGTQVSTHGNSAAGGYSPIEPVQFTRQCRQCHEPHGLAWNGSGRNLSMVGNWLDNTPGGNRNGLADPGEEAVVDSDGSLAFTTADRPVVFTAASGNGSYDDGFDDGLWRSVCVVCHNNLVNNHNQYGDTTLQGQGHNPVGTDCSGCHAHDFDGGPGTADGFMPSGCTGCHGNPAADTIWPDDPATVKTSYPDRGGRHLKHVEAVMDRLNETPPAAGGWSTAPRTLLTMSAGDQQRLCGYCHNDPSGVGGINHYPQGYTKDDAPADMGDFNPLWDTADPPALADGNAVYTDATYNLEDIYTGGSTCSAFDCHNSKSTEPLVYGWYDSTAGACTMCHTAGGTGTNPNSGLHILDDALNGTVSHDDDFGGSFTCTDCHQDRPTEAHISGTGDDPSTAVFNWDSTAMTLTLNVLVDDTDDTCTSSCHSDGGDWDRLWSLDADADHTVTTPGQAYCAVCHGEPGDFRNGIEHVASSPHGCDTCHFITSDPQHRDGTIEINDNLDASCDTPTNPTIGAAPAGLYCAGCHANDAGHTSPRTDGNYWPGDPRSFAAVCIEGGHPSAACLDCHNSAQGSFRLITDSTFSTGDFSLSSHHIDGALAATQAQKERGCIACHYENEAGGNDGLIGLKHYNAAGVNIDPETGQAYDVLNFDPADRAGTSPVVTTFCLGCHSQYMDTAQPFALTAGGDTSTPVSRSWDETSIAVKFDVSTTGRFSSYDSNTFNVTPAFYVFKADSPHRRPDLNERGIATSGAWSDSGGDAVGLQCLDCHNAHGSDVTVTRSWKISGSSAADDGSVGGILVGQSGRWSGWDYTPAASGSPGEYSAEADLCFDCHLGDDPAVDAGSYTDYGVSAAVTDYYSGAAGRWRTSDSWDTQSFTFKQPNAGGTGIQSSHWTGSLSTAAAHPVLDGAGLGQCTPCHDPHGVTPRADTTFLRTTNGGLKYPLLKGNWLTSPYKEDRAGDITTGASTLTRNWTGAGGTAPPPTPRETPDFRAGDDAQHFNNPPLIGGGYGTGVSGAGAYGVGNAAGHDGYFIDDNTWGVDSSNANPYWDESGNVLTVAYPASGPLSGTYSDFAGLCSVCHTSSDSGATGWPGSGSGRASIRSIHSTVKGWEGNSSWNPFDPNWYTGYDGIVDQHLMDGGRMPDQAGDPSQASKMESAGNQLTQISNGVTPKASNNFGRYNWAAHFPDDDTGQAPAPGYHRFSCSKCHSPHSQALPRLVKTNCIETSNNSEEGRQFRDYKQGINVPHTNSMACHGEDYHLPWNQVTPWDSAPPSASSPMPTGGKQWETY
jgi:hypothetical protein